LSPVESLMTPVAAAAPPAHTPLKERVLRASSWTVLAYGFTLLLRLGSTLILTRLLAPEAFGLMAIVSTIAIVISLLSDVGIRQSIVHSTHGDEPLMLNTAWTMQILRGVLIWSVCCLLALGLYGAGQRGWLTPGSVYAAPQLPLLLALGTLHSVVYGFDTTKRFTADRRIDQKRVVLIDLCAAIITIAVAIALAWLIRSVWAIVIGGFVAAVFTVIAGHLWLPGHRNRVAWHGGFARQIFDFGKWILASSLLYVIAANSDKLLLGVWVAPAVLGCFAVGQNLAQILDQAVSRVFVQVASPAFADVIRNSPQRLREVYLRMRLLFDVLFITAAGLLFAIGPWLVGVMYDARYAEAGMILQILSFSLIVTRYGVSSGAYLALQIPHAPAVMSLVRVIAFFTFVPLAHKVYGVNGAYWAIALSPAAMAPVVWWFDRRFGLLSWRHELFTLAAWPVGWVLGLAFVGAMQWMLQ
jgi:O-antigen/teichoic acid export membrane protein